MYSCDECDNWFQLEARWLSKPLLRHDSLPSYTTTESNSLCFLQEDGTTKLSPTFVSKTDVWPSWLHSRFAITFTYILRSFLFVARCRIRITSHRDIVLYHLIQFYLNNAINLRPLTQHIMSNGDSFLAIDSVMLLHPMCTASVAPSARTLLESNQQILRNWALNLSNTLGGYV